VAKVRVVAKDLRRASIGGRRFPLAFPQPLWATRSRTIAPPTFVSASFDPHWVAGLWAALAIAGVAMTAECEDAWTPGRVIDDWLLGKSRGPGPSPDRIREWQWADGHSSPPGYGSLPHPQPAGFEPRQAPSPLQGIPCRVLLPGDPDLQTVVLEDVCGLEGPVASMARVVKMSQRNALARLQAVQDGTRTKPPKGDRSSLIVLHGPPGTGKTMMTRALVHQLNCPVALLGFSDIADEFYGSTSKKLAAVLQGVSDYAASNEGGPVVLFIDEADSLLSRRGALAADTGKTAASTTDHRIVGQVLEFLDGFEKHPGVVVVLATNRVDVLDPALLSRASEVIAVPLPNAMARDLLWQHHAKHLSTRQREKLVALTVAMSGRDIVRLCELVEEQWVFEGLLGLPSLEAYCKAIDARAVSPASAAVSEWSERA
jgi:hypothetical protein